MNSRFIGVKETSLKSTLKVRNSLRLFASVSLLMPLGLAAETRCNLPNASPVKMCDDGDGISYRCPPCRPGLAMTEQMQNSRAQLERDRVRLEAFRENLESYREDIEADRARDPGASLTDYRKGLTEYREGLVEYRDGMRAYREQARVLGSNRSF